MKLLMIAAPGGGKGTQGDRLAAKFGVRHISSGDVLRAEVRAGTPAGRQIAAFQQRGDLVPDEIVFELLTPVVSAAAARGGYILDGFPRTVPQAITAADLGRRLDLTLDAAVYLNVPDPVLIQRLLARARADDTAEDACERATERPVLIAQTAPPRCNSRISSMQSRSKTGSLACETRVPSKSVLMS